MDIPGPFPVPQGQWPTTNGRKDSGVFVSSLQIRHRIKKSPILPQKAIVFFSCIAGRVRDIVGQLLELGRLKSN